MSIWRRIIFAVAAGWLSRVIMIVFGLLLTRSLFHFMRPDALGIWYILGQSGALLGLLDFGLSPTLCRRIAFAKGTAGADPNVKLTPEASAAIIELLGTLGVAYRVISALGFVVSLVAGGFFLSGVNTSSVPMSAVWLAWGIMCFSNAVGTWASKWNTLLNGLGYVGWDSVLVSAVTLATYLGQILCVTLGGGIVGLAIIATVGSFMTRSVAVWFMRRREPLLLKARGKFSWPLMKDILHPAIRLWLTSLGAFFIFRTSQYFIAVFFTTAQIPNYQAASQVVTNIANVAGGFASVSFVFISQMWQAGDLAKVHILVRRSTLITLILMLSGVAVLLVSGPDLFQLWLGPGHFIGYPILITFCTTWILESHHYVFLCAGRATEDEVYAPWTIAAGILNLVLSLLLVKPLGLWGLALATMLANMLTLNWYATYRGVRRLRMSIRSHIRQVILPMVVFFGLSLGMCFGIQSMTAGVSNAVVRIGLVAVAAGILAAACLLRLVLSKEQRLNLMRRALPAMAVANVAIIEKEQEQDAGNNAP